MNSRRSKHTEQGAAPAAPALVTIQITHRPGIGDWAYGDVVQVTPQRATNLVERTGYAVRVVEE